MLVPDPGENAFVSGSVQLLFEQRIKVLLKLARVAGFNPDAPFTTKDDLQGRP